MQYFTRESSLIRIDNNKRIIYKCNLISINQDLIEIFIDDKNFKTNVLTTHKNYILFNILGVWKVSYQKNKVTLNNFYHFKIL